MKIGFIGAGKVGTAFGMYLESCGHSISGYVSKEETSAVESAALTHSVAYPSLEALLKASDVVFITTPDTQIESFARQNRDLFQQYLCAVGHMSGALTSDILECLGCDRGIFSLHPLQAFATVEKGRQDLVTCTFALEGNDRGIAAVESLMASCNNPVMRLKKEQKPLYHGAACVVSNYLMAITALAEEMIESFAPDGEMSLSAYRNLMVGAIDNAIELGSARALTGPIARGDVKTIEKHLKSMIEPQMKKDYSTLGMMTVALASKEKLTDPVLEKELRSLLLK
ncbi:MAG: DUF2520 domain-containing protein [Clostridia bacterium]|nr:DUF2520 domain-containing protein [Clostridia bacterium]